MPASPWSVSLMYWGRCVCIHALSLNGVVGVYHECKQGHGYMASHTHTHTHNLCFRRQKKACHDWSVTVAPSAPFRTHVIWTLYSVQFIVSHYASTCFYLRSFVIYSVFVSVHMWVPTGINPYFQKSICFFFKTLSHELVDNYIKTHLINNHIINNHTKELTCVDFSAKADRTELNCLFWAQELFFFFFLSAMYCLIKTSSVMLMTWGNSLTIYLWVRIS